MSAFINDRDRLAGDPNPAELTLAFMTVTGAEPLQLAGISSCKRVEFDGKPVDIAIEAGAETVYPSWPASVLGIIDHPRAWRLNGEVFYSVEPYFGGDCESIAELFESAGWRCNPMPRGFGCWAPPRSRLFLVARSDSKIDLDEVRSRILRARAPYHAQSRHKDLSLKKLTEELLREETPESAETAESETQIAHRRLFRRL